MFELHGSIAVITLNSPPVNSLGAALRQHIAAAVHQGVLDPAVHAMVLIGNAKAFSAGADVSEFGTPRQLTEPMMGRLLARSRWSLLSAGWLWVVGWNWRWPATAGWHWEPPNWACPKLIWG